MSAFESLLTASAPYRAALQRLLPGAAVLLLAPALGLQLAELVWKAVPPPQVWTPLPVPPPETAAGRKGPDLAALRQAALFGTATAEAPADVDALADAPDTNLNLRLLGIFAGSGPEDSRALIASNASDEAPYAVGADVVRGVTLEAIFADRVILLRQGRRETLRLDKDAPSRAPTDAPVVAGSALPDNIALPQLSSVREQILQDPSQAANYLRVQPAAQDGAMRGYRIYPGRDRSLFNAAGLRPGDLVTAINGTELNDATRALQMLTELSTASSVSLTVERGGNPQTVNISLN
jgi:general secretion pathway protein C